MFDLGCIMSNIGDQPIKSNQKWDTGTDQGWISANVLSYTCALSADKIAAEQSAFRFLG